MSVKIPRYPNLTDHLHNVETTLSEAKLCMFEKCHRNFPYSVYSIGNLKIGNFHSVSEPVEEPLEMYDIVHKSPTTVNIVYTNNDCILRIHPIPQQHYIDVRMSFDDMRQLYRAMKIFFGEDNT